MKLFPTSRRDGAATSSTRVPGPRRRPPKLWLAGSLLLALLATAWLLLRQPTLTACSPAPPQAHFVRTLTPDFPLDGFSRGELGVVEPTWAKSYLFVAYRYLSDRPPDPSEQDAALALWEGRLSPSSYHPDFVEEWIEARSQVAADAPERIFVLRSSENYYFYYLNCPQDAFRTAALTLARRTKRFGASSPEVRDWVTAQDQVFGNCSGPHRFIPDASPGDSDRAYQIASAHFYAGDFETAEKMFRSIAGDARSPWRRIAPYLAARALIRRATLSGKDADRAVLAQAETQLQSILRDRGHEDLHPAARRMLGYVRFRLHPEERLQELSRAVLAKASQQDLIDYTRLLDRTRGPDDLSDWISTVQGRDIAHAVERWGQTSSTPWLVAAISTAPASHLRTPALLEAAAQAPPDSPAFPSLAYHRVRLLIELGRRDEARGALETVPTSLPPSARNLFVSRQLQLARNLDEFLRYAPRVPAGILWDHDHDAPRSNPLFDRLWDGGRVRLDADATRLFNYRLPVRLLQRAAKNSILPVHLRAELTQAAWARAALLDDAAAARDLAPVLAAHRPGLKPGLDVYLAAPDGASRVFAAVFLMLQFPGVRPYIDTGFSRQTPVEQIDDYRNNWWCAAIHHPRGPLPPFPEFLTGAQQDEARRQWEKVEAFGAGPTYLGAQAVEWARTHPEDARSPEALHLAVRSTRYGCTDKETSRWSRAAFELLHKRFPKSAWAAKTKYWF